MASGRVKGLYTLDAMERIFRGVGERAGEWSGTRFAMWQAWQEVSSGHMRLRFRSPGVGFADFTISEEDLRLSRRPEDVLSPIAAEVRRVADVLVPEARGL